MNSLFTCKIGSYKLSVISVILCCDGPIALCSTVVMYFDICIGVCHPLIVPHVCGTNEGVMMKNDERERERERDGGVKI